MFLQVWWKKSGMVTDLGAIFSHVENGPQRSHRVTPNFLFFQLLLFWTLSWIFFLGLGRSLGYVQKKERQQNYEFVIVSYALLFKCWIVNSIDCILTAKMTNICQK